MTMPDLSNLLAPVLARLDAIEADVRALRPPPAPPGWNVRAALDAIAAKVDAVGMPDAPTFEKIAAAYTRQTLALGEAQDERAAAIKEAEWLRAEIADLRRQRDEIGRRASTQDDDLRAIVGARGGETFRDGVVRLAKERNAAVARAERAEAALVVANDANGGDIAELREIIADAAAARRNLEARARKAEQERDEARAILEWMTANRDGFHAARDYERARVSKLHAKLRAAEAELTRLRASGPAAAVVEAARCNLTCPHGDRCRLASGHADGCNHACACNEPNEPGLWVTRSMVRSALRVGVEMTDTADADNLWTVLAAGDDLTKIPSEPKGRAARRDAAPQPAAAPPLHAIDRCVCGHTAIAHPGRCHMAPCECAGFVSAPQPAKGEWYVGRLRKGHIPMITPAHLPELWRLLVEHAEALSLVDDAHPDPPRDVFLLTSERYGAAARALAAFTRRVAAEPPPAPAGMEEIDDALLTVEMASENVALDNGRATIRRRDEAHDELLMLVRAALADRDERIAALERTESILRSVANVRTDGTIEQIAALVDVDIARRAAEWERMADEIAAANVEATARIAALEAGLRDAADDLADHERWWRTVDEIAKADDALASIRAARALADAGKVGA